MMPTGSGVVDQRVRTPDGDGTVKTVHDQDNMTVILDKMIAKFRNGKRVEENAQWVGDVSECDLWCEPCSDFHTHEKHTKKIEEKAGV